MQVGNVETTVNYLWDGSAYPGASLDDVYPRPSVSFAAKNQKSVQAAPQDNTKYYAGGIAAGLAFTGMAIFGLKKSQKEIVQPETLLWDASFIAIFSSYKCRSDSLEENLYYSL